MQAKHQKSILLLAEWADPRFYQGVASYVKQAGWHLALDYVYTHQLPARWRGDGCIAMAGKSAMPFLESLHVPVVHVTAAGSNMSPGVALDNAGIGKAAADFFLGLGFRNLACYSTDLGTETSVARHNGFAEQAAAQGASTTTLALKRKYRPKSGDWEKEKQWLKHQLRSLPKPLAVFCIDDTMAVRVVDACKECDIDIPADVSILGVGNMELACECSAVPLSSFRIDFEKIGYNAAAMLDEILAGAPPPSRHLVIRHSGIEERQSTHTLAAQNPAGQKALHFMLDNFVSPISLQQVCEAGGLTRRQLTYIVRDELHTSPGKLLEDLRIKKACNLLSRTHYPIKRVAHESGLGTALRLQRIFRKRFTLSPSEWRKQQQQIENWAQSPGAQKGVIGSKIDS